jgi:cytochrome P450
MDQRPLFSQCPLWTMPRNIKLFRKTPLAFFNELASRARVTKFHLLHMRFFLVSDPELLQPILSDAFKNYVKTPRAQRVTRMGIGQGIISTDQDLWIKFRQNARPAFQHQNIQGFYTVIQEETDAFINDINTHTSLECFNVMLTGTLRIINKVVFGVNGLEHVSAIIHCMDNLNAGVYKKMVSPVLFPLSIPTKTNRQFSTDRKKLFTMLDDLKSKSTEKGLIHYFNSPETSNSAFTEELISVITAGHETTASLLTWTLYELHRHPKHLQQVRDELSKLPASCDWDTLSKNTSFTQAVINEVLRLYPPIWLMARTAIKPHMVGALQIKGGDNVLIAPYILHRLTEYWTMPDTFDPHRFLNKNITDIPSFIPFSIGPRACIGIHFALMESLIILRKLLTVFELSVDTTPKKLNPYVTLRPGSPIVITFKPAVP